MGSKTLNPELYASIEDCEELTRKYFQFLVADYGFQEPHVSSWAGREISIVYRRVKGSVTIGYEVGGGCGCSLKPGNGGEILASLVKVERPEPYPDSRDPALSRDMLDRLLCERARILKLHPELLLSPL